RAPALLQELGSERRDEGEGEPKVEDDADDHGADDRDRDVAPRVLGLGAQLDGLLEAQVGEDHPADWDGGEDSLPAEGVEAASGGEVARVEGHDQQHDHGDGRDGDLPPYG